jgi:hypothetical protein
MMMTHKVEKYGKKFAVVKDGNAVEAGFVDYASAKAVADKLNGDDDE